MNKRNSLMKMDSKITSGYEVERESTGIDYPGTSNDDSHQYDGDGVRMMSKLNGASDWTKFIVCPITGELLAEYTLISSTFTMKSVNTWGIGLISTNREGTKRYFHFDGVGSTVALTQADGAVTDTYVYSAFGVLESSTGSSVNPFRYIGQFGYYDDTSRGSNSGFLLLGVRYYSPARGAFISWDSMRTPNFYNYVNSNPTGAIDPTGRVSVGLPSLPTAILDPIAVQGPGGAVASGVLDVANAVLVRLKQQSDYEDCIRRCDRQRDQYEPPSLLESLADPSTTGLGPGMSTGDSRADLIILIGGIVKDRTQQYFIWVWCVYNCNRFLPTGISMVGPPIGGGPVSIGGPFGGSRGKSTAGDHLMP